MPLLSLVTGYLQFSFKRSIGCVDVIFAFKSIIHNFVHEGSSLFVASLNTSNAFNRVNHYKLCNSLLAAGLSPASLKLLR
jgi:hypothetical protein